MTSNRINLPVITNANPLTDDDLRQINLIQKDTGRGGLWWSEVQAALEYLFKDAQEVFVPAATSLLGELHALPLLGLKARGIKFIAFSLPAASINNRGDFQHQVAIWMDMRSDVVRVCIYNSEGKSLNRKAKTNLKILIGDMPHEQLYADSPYEDQNDFWSCGVFVVKHLLHSYADEEVSEAKATLPVNDLIAPIFAAAKLGMKLVEERQVAINIQVSAKRILYDAIEKVDTVAFKQLTAFMKSELNAATSIGGAVDHEHLRTRSLEQTIEAFKKDYSDQVIAIGVLQAAYWASVHNHLLLVKIVTSLIAVFTKDNTLTPLRLSKENEKRLTSLEKLYCVLVTTLDLAEAPADEWRKMFDLYIVNSEKTCAEILTTIFAAFEDLTAYQPASISSTDAYRLACHLLLKAVDHICCHSADIENEKKRLTSEAAAREEQAQKHAQTRLPDLKAILKDIALTNIEESICKKIAGNPVLFYKVKRYFTPEYFAGCDEAVKVKMMTHIVANPNISLVDLVVLFPGDAPADFYEKQGDVIDDVRTALYVLRAIKLYQNKKAFYQSYKLLLKKEGIFADVLQAFEEGERLIVATDLADLVTTVESFNTIKKHLPQQDRYAFAAHFLLRPYDAMAFVLKAFTQDEIVVFAEQHSRRIKERHILSLIDHLPMIERYNYAMELYFLMDDKMFLRVLAKLDSSFKRLFLAHRKNLAFLSHCDAETRNKILDQLLVCSEEQMLTITCLVTDLTENIAFPECKRQFDSLPPELQAMLMPEFLRKIKILLRRYDGSYYPAEHNDAFQAVLLLITNIPPNDRMDIARKYSHLIKTKDQIVSVLILLRSNDYSEFIVVNDSAVNMRIWEIIDSLPSAIRLNFALANSVRMNNTFTLLQVMTHLQPAEKFVFIKQCKHVIKTVDNMVELIPAFSESDAADFAVIYSDLITMPTEFSRVLKVLPAKAVCILKLFNVMKDKAWFTEDLIKKIFDKLEEKTEFFNLCIDREVVKKLEAKSTIFKVLINENPIRSLHFVPLIRAMITGEMQVNKGALILFATTVFLDFKNQHLPSFLRNIHLENKNKLYQLLWPLLILLEDGQVKMDDLAWLADNKQPERTDNLVTILAKMCEVDNSNVQNLLQNQFSIIELLDCPSLARLKIIIDIQEAVIANLTFWCKSKNEVQKYKRGVLGHESDDRVEKMIGESQQIWLRNKLAVSDPRLFSSKTTTFLSCSTRDMINSLSPKTDSFSKIPFKF